MSCHKMERLKKRRKYTNTVFTKSGSYESLRKGLVKIHIGDDVWLIGKQKNNHSVIYGPENKEYHVQGDDLKNLCNTSEDYWGNSYFHNVRNGNIADPSKTKIYILTHILDKPEHWCFDLSVTPENGKLKVICSNGTVKIINFKGEFKPLELISKRFISSRLEINRTFVNPVAYRKI